MTGFWDDAEVIAVYTREQAIEDGVLVPVTDLVPDEPLFASQAGFHCHVALTSALANLVMPSNREQEEYAQSIKGRLWDVLNMGRMYSARARRDDVAGEGVNVFFPCIFQISGRADVTTRSGARFTGQRTYKLWFSLAPGDHGEPVVTIGFPEDR